MSIVFVRADFKVFWANTGFVVTDVADNQTIRNRANEMFIAPDVRTFVFVAGTGLSFSVFINYGELAITFFV